MPDTVDKSTMRYCSGAIETFRPPDAEDLKKFKSFKAKMPDYVDTSIEPVLAIEGWLSTGEVDRQKDIIEPGAWSKHLADFMKNPSLMFNHDWSHLPLGIWTDVYVVPDKGLYGKCLIFGTEMGNDVAMLVRAGVLRSFSVGFTYHEFSTMDDGGWRILDAELIECSIVSVPANLGAVIEHAKSLNIKLNYLTNTSGGRGTSKGITMPEIITKADIDSSVTPVREDLDKTKTTVKELGAEFEKVAKIQHDLKDAVANGTKTSGEMRELVDKVSGEFQSAIDDLQGKYKEFAKRRPGNAFDFSGPLNLKSMITKRPADVDATFGGSSEVATKVKHLQKMHDKVAMLDALLEASSRNNTGDYHQRNRNARIKGLRTYGELVEFAKAMDSTTSDEGDEWVPSDMSGNMIERVHVELKVASLFDKFPMPSNPFVMPVEGGDTDATLMAEKTAIISAFDSTEQTPGTEAVTFTAAKGRSRIQVSHELTEDSAIAIMPYVEKKAGRGLARVIDRCIINGDKSSGGTASFDTGYTPATTDFRHGWDGLRYHYQTNITSTYGGQDCSTFNETNVGKVRSAMGKYGLYPSDLIYLCSVKAYLQKFLRELDNYQTLDKYGPNAVILNGELAKVDGVPLVISEFMYDNLNADGIYDGTTTDRSEILCLNRNMWLIGEWGGIRASVEEDKINDVYQVVAFKRLDFEPVVTPSSTEVIVASGYNVTF